MGVITNPTSWRPQSGQGYIQFPGLAFIVDQSGNFIIDQSKNFIVTTPTLTVPKYTTTWTPVAAT
jgi:hypothetical protein